MKKLLITALLVSSGWAVAQQSATPMFNSMAKGESGLRGYIFVSSQMSDTSLIAYAGDASRSGMTLVLNGYVDESPKGLLHTQQKVQEINRACCGEKGGAHWQINPPLYDLYQVKTVPTFVIAKGESKNPNDFSKVSGEMSVANALKYFYQRSSIPEIKAESARVYKRLAGSFNNN